MENSLNLDLKAFKKALLKAILWAVGVFVLSMIISTKILLKFKREQFFDALGDLLFILVLLATFGVFYYKLGKMVRHLSSLAKSEILFKNFLIYAVLSVIFLIAFFVLSRAFQYTISIYTIDTWKSAIIIIGILGFIFSVFRLYYYYKYLKELKFITNEPLFLFAFWADLIPLIMIFSPIFFMIAWLKCKSTRQSVNDKSLSKFFYLAVAILAVFSVTGEFAAFELLDILKESFERVPDKFEMMLEFLENQQKYQKSFPY